jgi:hypothetical protein
VILLDVVTQMYAIHPSCLQLIVTGVELVFAQPVVVSESLNEPRALKNDG